jgi:hypothetical protein
MILADPLVEDGAEGFKGVHQRTVNVENNSRDLAVVHHHIVESLLQKQKERYPFSQSY